MKSLCVIPARYQSSRLPGKPLVDICGQSLISRVYHRVHDMGLFEHVVVATDDQRILDHAKEQGIPIMMTSADHVSGTDRVAEVSSKLPDYEVVINVQGDEPMIEGELLEQMIYVLMNGDIRIATGVAPIKSDLDNPNKVKVVLDEKDRALYFSRSVIPYSRTTIEGHSYYRHIGTYGFRRKTLMEIVKLKPSVLEKVEQLEQLRWLQNGYQIHCVPGPWEGFGVDTPEDVLRMEDWIKRS